MSNEQVVETLIKAGADVNTTDEVSHYQATCVIAHIVIMQQLHIYVHTYITT